LLGGGFLFLKITISFMSIPMYTRVREPYLYLGGWGRVGLKT
jgi:hypothetical protein